MSDQPVNDCWNQIGVRGDVTCPELQRHLHCHNCPVHAQAALALLDREPPAGTHAGWTAHFAEPLVEKADGTVPLFVFRVGADWLGMPAPLVVEVAPERTVHSLPHTAGGGILGVVNVHGSLVVGLSLGAILGLDRTTEVAGGLRFARERMLIVRHGDLRAACPVDEVSGIQRVDPSALVDTPATVMGARACVTRIWMRRDDTVGVLDETLLGQALRRSLA
jgi:chemotaxis-related protein WspD